MTSPRSTFQDLPDDILVEIFNVSDEATLMACDSVSDRFHHVIQSVPQLAYRFALKAAGVEEILVPDEATASQRHTMLQNYICTWLEPTVVDMSYLLPSEAAWQRSDESDAIFGNILWERLLDDQHKFTEILSPKKWGQKPSWMILNTRDHIAVDVSEHLLVIPVVEESYALVHSKTPPSDQEIWIRLLDLDTGNVHPWSGPKLVYKRNRLEPSGPLRIHESHLLVCEHNVGLIVWNWQSGAELMEFRDVDDAIFLTEDLLLIAKMAEGPKSPSTSTTCLWPRLVVFSIARRLALLKLECPPIHYGEDKGTTPIRFLRDTTPSYPEEIPPAFSASVEDRVIGISIGTMIVPKQPSSVPPPKTDDFWTDIRNSGRGGDIEDPCGVRCAFYIPMSTIWRQIHLAETQLPNQHVVPWTDWGPEGSHMVLSPDTAGILRLWRVLQCATMSTCLTVTTCGMRALEVLPPCNEAGLQYLRVYDFSIHARHSNNVPSESFATRENDPVPPSDSYDELAAKFFVEPQFAKTRYPVHTRLVPLPLLPEGAEHVWDTVSMVDEHILFGRSIPLEISFYTPINRTLSESEMVKRFAVMAI